jgi:hypothetical protein
MTFVPLLYLGLIHTLPATTAACSCCWCSARPASKVSRRPGVASFADSPTWRCRPPRLRATCTPSPGRLRQSHSQHSVSLYLLETKKSRVRFFDFLVPSFIRCFVSFQKRRKIPAWRLLCAAHDEGQYSGSRFGNLRNGCLMVL